MRCSFPMVVDQNTRQFVLSWQNAREYPLNLVRQGCKFGALRAHRKLLDSTAPDLFNPRSRVVVIELDERPDRSGKSSCLLLKSFANTFAAISQVITSEDGLKSWLAIPDDGSHIPSPTLSERPPEEMLPPPMRAQSQADSDWTCVSSRSNTLDVTDKIAGPDTAVTPTANPNPNTAIRCRFM